MSDILPDGCFPKHDSTQTYCTEYKGRVAEYPRFRTYQEIKTIEEWASTLKVSRRWLADGRYIKPALPYIRLGKVIMLAESQLIWWLNELQTQKPDNYFLDRRRRLARGIPVAPKKSKVKADDKSSRS